MSRSQRSTFTVGPALQHALLPRAPAAAGAPLVFTIGWRRMRHAAQCASISLSSQPAPPGSGPPQLLFSLARAPRGAEAPPLPEGLEGGSSGEDGPSSSGGSSGDEYSDLDSGEVDTLMRINCCRCRKPMVSKKAAAARAAGQAVIDPASILVCNGCQRCYHEECAEKAGIDVEGGDTRHGWFHSFGCEEAHLVVQDQVRAGETPLPGGRSWEVVACRDLPDVSQHRALNELIDVLAPSFGPAIVEQIESSRYAVLLRQGADPVSAALIDVYGQDASSVDLIATALERRGEGHCRALVDALHAFLAGRVGTQRMIVALEERDTPVEKMWRQHFGYKRLEGRALRRLQDDLPALGANPPGCVVLTRELKDVAAALAAGAAAAAAAADKAGGEGRQRGQGAAGRLVEAAAREAFEEGLRDAGAGGAAEASPTAAAAAPSLAEAASPLQLEGGEAGGAAGAGGEGTTKQPDADGGSSKPFWQRLFNK